MWIHLPITKREKGTCSVEIVWCFSIFRFLYLNQHTRTTQLQYRKSRPFIRSQTRGHH